MHDLLESLGRRLEGLWKKRDARAERHSRNYRCRCGNNIFFDNTLCLVCDAQLGLVPDSGKVIALAPGPRQGTWTAETHDELLKFCANRDSAAACNWMVYARNPRIYCIACRLNRTIPNLDDGDNVRYWVKIEAAKRRMVAQLLALGLPLSSQLEEDPERGLMFDFLRSPPKGPSVMTGHGGGLITINVEEADDVRRERIRYELREPYRTLLGHFRYEVGHYYWFRLVWDTPWLEPARQVFSDERASYGEALEHHYGQGPPADWANSYITSYATAHPWGGMGRDVSSLSARGRHPGNRSGPGVDTKEVVGEIRPFTRDALLLIAWLAVTMVLNELARSMGQPDHYPLVMSKAVWPSCSSFKSLPMHLARTRISEPHDASRCRALRDGLKVNRRAHPQP